MKRKILDKQHIRTKELVRDLLEPARIWQEKVFIMITP